MGALIDVVLPALDEADALPGILDAMPEGYRPVVVDNGSRDATALVAAELGAVVVHEPSRGFGAACYAGLLASEAEVVCFMDADGSFDPRQLPMVAEPVRRGSADLVLGARRAEPGSWPWHLRVANRVVVAQLRRVSGVHLGDLGPMRAARRRDLLDLDLADRRSGWPLEMVLAAAAAGWRINEVEVDHHPRIGASKVTGTLRGALRAVSDMSRQLRAHGPSASGSDRAHGSSASGRDRAHGSSASGSDRAHGSSASGSDTVKQHPPG